MAKPYTVVLEYTLKTRGLAGIRFSQTYQNKDVFDRTFYDKGGLISVISQGVSLAQATNLVSLTPEVCRLSAAVEHLCRPDGSISNLQTAQFEINQAIIRITEDRLQREANNLTPQIPFPFVEIPQDLFDRSQLFRFIKFTYDTKDGTVDDKIPTVHSSMMTMIEELSCLSNEPPASTEKKERKKKSKKSIPLT